MGKYRAALLMVAAAVVCVLVHFYAGWEADMNEAAMHGQSAVFSEYVIEWTRDTFENLQSEFWQLAVQFALLAGFFKFIAVRAYEEDQEEIKERVKHLEAMVNGQVTSR